MHSELWSVFGRAGSDASGGSGVGESTSIGVSRGVDGPEPPWLRDLDIDVAVTVRRTPCMGRGAGVTFAS